MVVPALTPVPITVCPTAYEPEERAETVIVFDTAVEQRQRRAFRGEEQCGPPPYPGRCTGNQYAALLQATCFGHRSASSRRMSASRHLRKL